MKKLFLFLTIFLSCSISEKEVDLVQFNSQSNYLEKEFVLEDIADVSYVFFKMDKQGAAFRGKPLHISLNTITIFDFPTGDFHLFDLKGNLTSHFNRKGSGPEDYMNVISAFVDEKKGELYVIEKNKIKVYNKEGIFLRTLHLPNEAWVYEAAEYDDNSILLADNYERATGTYADLATKEADTYAEPFVRISKTDGNLIEYIPIPKDFSVDMTAPFQMGEMTMKVGGPLYRIVANKQGFLLYNQEIDTLFLYSKNETLNPIWVHTPPVKDMETKDYLNAYVEAGGYQFFEKVTLKIEKTPPPPSLALVYDPNVTTFFRQKVMMKDFKGKVIPITPELVQRTRNAQIGHLMLPLSELKQALNEGLLSGDLKEIVTASEEEGNDVLMLLHFK